MKEKNIEILKAKLEENNQKIERIRGNMKPNDEIAEILGRNVFSNELLKLYFKKRNSSLSSDIVELKNILDELDEIKKNLYFNKKDYLENVKSSTKSRRDLSTELNNKIFNTVDDYINEKKKEIGTIQNEVVRDAGMILLDMSGINNKFKYHLNDIQELEKTNRLGNDRNNLLDAIDYKKVAPNFDAYNQRKDRTEAEDNKVKKSVELLNLLNYKYIDMRRLDDNLKEDIANLEKKNSELLNKLMDSDDVRDALSNETFIGHCIEMKNLLESGSNPTIDEKVLLGYLASGLYNECLAAYYLDLNNSAEKIIGSFETENDEINKKIDNIEGGSLKENNKSQTYGHNVRHLRTVLETSNFNKSYSSSPNKPQKDKNYPITQQYRTNTQNQK